MASEDKCRKSAPPERSLSLADKSYVCKELMQAGAGSEEGAAGSPPLQKSFGSFLKEYTQHSH